VKSRRKKGKAFPIYRGRRFLLMSLLLFGLVILLLRAAYLEIYQHDFLQAESDKKQTTIVSIPAYRGMILDRNGEALAISSPVKTLVVSPKRLLKRWESLQKKLKERRTIFELKGDAVSPKERKNYEIAQKKVEQFEYAFSKVAELLNLNSRDWWEQLKKIRHRSYKSLGKNKTPEFAKKVLALKLAGVSEELKYKRFYPMAESASHVIGFTNSHAKGVHGIERAKETALAGKDGKKRVMRNRRGHIIENIELLYAMDQGQDITLSIDRRLQYATYKALKIRVFELKAETGAAVVLDTQTGEILAMASMPGFNPNDRSKLQAYRYRNRAVADMFEAGSTMKPLTIAAAIEARVIDTDVKIDTSPGLIKLSQRYTVRDHANYGKMSLSYLLAKSSNVGASRIALLMEPRDHWMFLSRLGFGRVTGAGFSIEAAGSLSNYATWGRVDSASHGYGYGIAVTLLQMVRAYTPFATGGQLRPVSITKLKKQSLSQTVMSEETANAVLQMMETVVAPNATGKLAAVAGYRVAGKTGTARKLVNKKYRTDRFVTSFVGIAPVSKPRLVVGVMINDPKYDKSGGKAAAPVFAKIMAAALRIMDIAPDKLPEKANVLSIAKGAAS